MILSKNPIINRYKIRKTNEIGSNGELTDQHLWRMFYFSKFANCTKCGKEFEYGGEKSPLIKNRLWRRVCNFYHISEEDEHNKEKKRFELIMSPLTREQTIIEEKTNQNKYHIFFCLECMEAALHRKITINDLEDDSFNDKFIEEYLKTHAE